jgi:hypothetical protein
MLPGTLGEAPGRRQEALGQSKSLSKDATLLLRAPGLARYCVEMNIGGGMWGMGRCRRW